MLLGKVVGSVWTTQKESGMENLKLLMIEPMNGSDTVIIAADRIGAGAGDDVLITQGTPAHHLFNNRNVPIDAVVVGIVDSFERNNSCS
ncbi:EutN/CcmL family microcompartment protein [Bacillus massiliigorillae]|uniref:EutN/CcmL family microcompartment protein n=1 Tax=Bacillus massiliigorillae TaxID=1243664 RepID=UPI0003A883E2|nr:EutN/CcmL family microcompartment protein [Bacillus massiliigorillae]